MPLLDRILPNPDIRLIPSVDRPDKGSFPEKFLITDYYTPEYLAWLEQFSSTEDPRVGEIVQDPNLPSIHEEPFDATLYPDMHRMLCLANNPHAIIPNTHFTLNDIGERADTLPSQIPPAHNQPFMYQGFIVLSPGIWHRQPQEGPIALAYPRHIAASLGYSPAVRTYGMAQHPTASFQRPNSTQILEKDQDATGPAAADAVRIYPRHYQLRPKQSILLLYALGQAIPSPHHYDLSRRPLDRKRAAEHIQTATSLQQNLERAKLLAHEDR